jgi:hypothetical protein
MEVTMTFNVTLRETHGTTRWISLPPREIVGGMASCTNARIESTAKKEAKSRRHSGELLHEMNDMD